VKWNPIIVGQGQVPTYLASLRDELQEDSKNKFCERLWCEHDGSLKLIGRAISIKGNY